MTFYAILGIPPDADEVDVTAPRWLDDIYFFGSRLCWRNACHVPSLNSASDIEVRDSTSTLVTNRVLPPCGFVDGSRVFGTAQ